MRLRLLAAAGLFVASCAAHADTLLNYTISGKGTEYLPSPDEYTISNVTFTGTATYDVDAQLFTDFSFPTYFGPVNFAGVSYTTSTCDQDMEYVCFAVAPDDSFIYINNTTQDLNPGGGYGPEPYLLTYQGNLTLTASTVTPEPSSFALLGTGLFGVAGVMRRKFTHN